MTTLNDICTGQKLSEALHKAGAKCEDSLFVWFGYIKNPRTPQATREIGLDWRDLIPKGEILHPAYTKHEIDEAMFNLAGKKECAGYGSSQWGTYSGVLHYDVGYAPESCFVGYQDSPDIQYKTEVEAAGNCWLQVLEGKR